MADTYKILGQALTGSLSLDNSTVKEEIVYEVPENTQASISAIEITNSDIANQTYRLSFVKNAEVEDAYTSIPYTTYINQPNIVVVGSGNPYALSTQNGTTWTRSTLPYDTWWVSIAYGNGRYIVGSAAMNNVASSQDGITWTLYATIPNGNIETIVYENGMFFAVGAGQISYSTDGLNWYSAIIPWDSWYTATYGNGKFVAITSSSSGIAYSSNGTYWTQTWLPYAANWRSIAYGNGRFIATAAYDTAMVTSTDGVNWSMLVGGGGFMGYNFITYGNGKFIKSSNGAFAYSTDGANWYDLGFNAYTMYLKYQNNKFVAGPLASSNVYLSDDGMTWTISSHDDYSANWRSAAVGVNIITQTNYDYVPQSQNKHIAIYNKTIAPGETHEIKGGVTLSAGDQIRVYSSSAEIITNVYGVEIA